MMMRVSARPSACRTIPNSSSCRARKRSKTPACGSGWKDCGAFSFAFVSGATARTAKPPIRPKRNGPWPFRLRAFCSAGFNLSAYPSPKILRCARHSPTDQPPSGGGCHNCASLRPAVTRSASSFACSSCARISSSCKGSFMPYYREFASKKERLPSPAGNLKHLLKETFDAHLVLRLEIRRVHLRELQGSRYVVVDALPVGVVVNHPDTRLTGAVA